MDDLFKDKVGLGYDIGFHNRRAKVLRMVRMWRDAVARHDYVLCCHATLQMAEMGYFDPHIKTEPLSDSQFLLLHSGWGGEQLTLEERQEQLDYWENRLKLYDIPEGIL